MVIFTTESAIAHAIKSIQDLSKKLEIGPEFKFGKLCNDYRDEFFREVCKCDFISRSVVVDKSKIYSPTLRENKDKFYNYFIGQMLRHDNGVLKDAKVIIDGSGDRDFKKEFCGYLRRSVDAGCVRKVSLKDSKGEPLIQLADMVAGAIARSYKSDKPDAGRWRSMLGRSGKIDNIWNFR
ncbi:hypothetical protein HK28_12495 [Acetobacter sp. DsW_063]|nr:hypothetical protein HK28_12495 [Acetobacter sp. DsW_063]